MNLEEKYNAYRDASPENRLNFGVWWIVVHSGLPNPYEEKRELQAAIEGLHWRLAQNQEALNKVAGLIRQISTAALHYEDAGRSAESALADIAAWVEAYMRQLE